MLIEIRRYLINRRMYYNRDAITLAEVEGYLLGGHEVRVLELPERDGAWRDVTVSILADILACKLAREKEHSAVTPADLLALIRRKTECPPSSSNAPATC